MKKISYIILSFSLLVIYSCAGSGTSKEKNKDDGWVNLIQDNSLKGWHTYGQDTIGSAWEVTENGEVHLNSANKDDWQTIGGGDIVTENEYGDFHLKLEWKIQDSGNSGIIFYVHEEKDNDTFKYPWQTGPEMQVLDNNGHPDAQIAKHRAGNLYDLISSSTEESVKPAGEWNLAEIVSKDGNLQLYLNDTLVVETTLWDSAWHDMIANSKFATMPYFGTYKKGKISLQDHGNDVWYRNIMIKELE